MRNMFILFAQHLYILLLLRIFLRFIYFSLLQMLRSVYTILRNINLSLLYTARSSRQNRIIHARVIKLNYSLRIHIMYLCARYDMVATHLCGCCLLLLLKYYVVCSILKTFLISFRRRSVALNVRGVYNDNVPYHIYSL